MKARILIDVGFRLFGISTFFPFDINARLLIYFNCNTRCPRELSPFKMSYPNHIYCNQHLAGICPVFPGIVT